MFLVASSGAVTAEFAAVEKDDDRLQAIGKPAVQSLVDRLAQTIDENVTVLIIKTLGGIGTDANDATEVLLQRAKTDNNDVRFYVVVALTKVARDLRILVPELIRFLDDDDPGVKSAAVLALGRIGLRAASSIPKLVPMLDSEETSTGLSVLAQSLNDRLRAYTVRYEAALAVNELGKRARPVAKQLVALLEDDEALVRCAGVMAVASVQPPGFIDLLVCHSKDQSAVVRKAVFESLAKLSSRGHFVGEPVMVEMMDH